MPREETSPDHQSRAERLTCAAGELVAAVRSLHGDLLPRLPEDTQDTQLAQDLDRLLTSAESFASRREEWFPAGREMDSQQMAQARHDARNVLNHIFGGVHLIQATTGSALPENTFRHLLEILEHCLQLVSEIPLADRSGELPAGEDAATVPVSTAEPAPPVEATILVADDDPENRRILKRLLIPHGYQIEVAKNGAEALEAIARRAYDAVLLDIQMPVMDGFEVLSRLRESGELRHTPVIVVTGLQEEQDAVRCIEIGAEDFLSRPIRPALLMARLNASMEKKRLREKVFEQHFTPELAKELARNPDPMKMQARQAEVTVLFCDIRQFSSISERLGPSHTVEWLSGVLGHFSSIVMDHGGVLVDYTGDELMAMWGAPNEQADHAVRACRTALRILESLPEINELWRPVVEAETAVGIGINTGEALVGNIGTHRRFKYGPLGTTVNLASRVQGATRYLKTDLLITQHTMRHLPPDLATRRLCQARVLNISRAIDLHELHTPLHGDSWSRVAQCYESALEAFEQGEFVHAVETLESLLQKHPEDGPSIQLLARVLDAQGRFSPESFSPVWNLPGK